MDYGTGISQAWNEREFNGLHLSASIMHRLIYEQLEQKKIMSCHSDQLAIRFYGRSHLLFHFANKQPNKSLAEHHIEQFLRQESKFVEEEIQKFLDFDILIFNPGNQPMYDYQKHFAQDLRIMNLEHKPVIWSNGWYGGLHVLPVHEFFVQHPNVLWIDFRFRIRHKLWIYDGMNLSTSNVRYLLENGGLPSHYCQPGITEHMTLALFEVINLLTAIDKYVGF
jgi:hypothetical protein